MRSLARAVTLFSGGFAIASAIAVSLPTWRTGLGSGEDERGGYDYWLITLRFSRCSVELHYWPEKETS